MFRMIQRQQRERQAQGKVQRSWVKYIPTGKDHKLRVESLFQLMPFLASQQKGFTAFSLVYQVVQCTGEPVARLSLGSSGVSFMYMSILHVPAAVYRMASNVWKWLTQVYSGEPTGAEISGILQELRQETMVLGLYQKRWRQVHESRTDRICGKGDTSPRFVAVIPKRGCRAMTKTEQL